MTLDYNPAGQRTVRTQSNRDYGWTAGFKGERPYQVNGLNQYTGAGSAVFGYDANGNLTSDGTTSYAYDIENRLVSTGDGVTLDYDPLGRLWRTSGGSHGASRFLVDGDHVVAEYGDGGEMRRRFFWGPGADEPILQDEGGAMDCTGTRFLHDDEQGSVIAAADCDGLRRQVDSYDEYGIPAATNWGRFQYTGQMWLPELGMAYYKARFYSPTLGRFLQTDPIGYDDQVNLYAYVANDPVNMRDPTGTEGACVYGPSQCNNTSPSNVPSNLRAAADFITDFLPFIGDAKSAYEAYQNPTAVNVIVAAIGVVPGAGDVAAKAIRSLERGARTLEKRALQHDIKAAREAANPTVRPGMEGRSPQEVAKQQAARQEHLRKESAEFRKQAVEKRELADQLRKKLND